MTRADGGGAAGDEAAVPSPGGPAVGAEIAPPPVGIPEGVSGYPVVVMMSEPLPADLTAPARARALLRASLADWGLSGQVDDAEIVVSELVANAIRHGTVPIRLTVGTGGDVLLVSVEDGDSVHPPLPRTAGEFDTGGRGLLLVGAMSQRWGWSPTDNGKAVWAELPLG
jgi:anti-sigma regulatory factor (Ser/Thr protein kinase)